MVAQYPPMGWNSWDCYGASVTEQQVRQNAEYMARHLKLHGWEYVVVDIQWYQPTAINHEYEPFSNVIMDAYGRLLPAENRFPSAASGAGFKPLADYVHELGLKFGIHIMRGMPRMAAHLHLPIWNSPFFCHQAADPNSICSWNPDMYGLKCQSEAAKDYYESLFSLYAGWGVDFIKCDDIAREYPRCEREIELISNAVRGCGREMVLSLSPGAAPVDRAEHLKTYANMWRITDDFWDQWDLLKGMFERAEKWCIHAAPGHWPDADMLPVGALRQCDDPNGWTKFTEAEQRTMITLWSMMRSPMMTGGELTKNDRFTLRLLTNTEVLNIGKESFCGHPLTTTASESIWLAPRQDGNGVYVALFNLSDEERCITMPKEQLGHSATSINELWSKQSTDALSALLAPHDAAVYLVSY